MYTSTLAVIALLGSAILVSALPACNCGCPVDRSILKSCKDLTSDYDNGQYWLKASCQDINEAWNPTSLNLDQVLGNFEGEFEWGGDRFSLTAADIKLDSKTAVLSATLDLTYDSTDFSQVNLADRIENDCGQLKYVPQAPPSDNTV